MTSHERRTFRILMTARYLPPEYSGAAVQAFLLADRLRRRGHGIEFVTQCWRDAPREYEIDGFRVTALKTNLRARHGELSLWRSLLGYLWKRRGDFDILHSHGAYYTQSAIGPFGKLFGMRSLVKASLANNDLRSLTDSKVARLHRLFLSQVDAYVAISTDLGREFLARGLEPKRIFAIPNGVDVERFRPADRAEKRALAESLGIPTNRPIGQAVRERCCWLSSFVWRIMRLHIDTVREILPGSVSAATF